MNVKMSDFLQNHKTDLQTLVKSLSADFPFVSILGTDTKGTKYRVTKTGASVNESIWVERGFVVRVYNGSGYSEYSFNEIADLNKVEQDIRKIVVQDVEYLKSENIILIDYPLINEDPLIQSHRGTVEILPDSVSPEDIIDTMTKTMNRGLSMADFLTDMRIIFEYAHISKIYISTEKVLEQAYMWANALVIPIGRNDKGVKYFYTTFSGLKGVEVLNEMDSGLESAVKVVEDLLSAERLVPGEYDIICDPEMTGLIAHEAFGHGVEMDMFVKDRAKAVKYLDKEVASRKIQMFDGAKSTQQVSSYIFDDEGTLGTDTQIIENGILKTGISDLLSALKLGTTPTGNGKRESFERKAYARMTNTFFSPGKDSKDEMIQSIKKGYLLESFDGGMEDPKNWGIQCVAALGREIINGKLTGNVVSPVYLTGYVPDLLKNISMISDDLELSGDGMCGKGFKEFSKTSSGGPFLKTKGRLA